MEEALPARIAVGNTFLVEADPARGTGLAGLNHSAIGLALEGIGVHRDGPAAALVDWRARRLRCRHAVRAVERAAIGTAVTGGRCVATRSTAFVPLQRPAITAPIIRRGALTDRRRAHCPAERIPRWTTVIGAGRVRP